MFFFTVKYIAWECRIELTQMVSCNPENLVLRAMPVPHCGSRCSVAIPSERSKVKWFLPRSARSWRYDRCFYPFVRFVSFVATTCLLRWSTGGRDGAWPYEALGSARHQRHRPYGRPLCRPGAERGISHRLIFWMMPKCRQSKPLSGASPKPGPLGPDIYFFSISTGEETRKGIAQVVTMQLKVYDRSGELMVHRTNWLLIDLIQIEKKWISLYANSNTELTNWSHLEFQVISDLPETSVILLTKRSLN